MEKGNMKDIEVFPNANESMDIVVNDIPIVNLTRAEVEHLYFHLGVHMMEQDLQRSSDVYV